MIVRFADFCDRLLFDMARIRTGVSVGYLICGIFLLMVSFGLKLHHVEFDGTTSAGVVSGLNPGAVKQVGYVWAPNWAFASILVLPLAIFNLLAARGSAEMILYSLTDRKMLVRTNGGHVDLEYLKQEWQKTTRSWSVFTLASIFGIGVFIITTDFLPVVGNWLSSEQFRQDNMVGLNISHPDYEFDWSIAALFLSTDLSWQANYAFSLAVYLLVPIFGAGLIFGMFIWLASISTFFSTERLKTEGYVVIPDLESKDPRRGFEVFENLFDNLLRAGLMTAVMALCMHYQNVFLRTPSHENILEMLFADTVDVANGALSGDFGPMMAYFVSFDKIIYIDNSGISLQTYATALVNLLIFVIIMGLMWRWLRKLAVNGLGYTARNIPVTPAQKKRLQTMEIWPVGWMSKTLLLLVVALTLAAMYYVNLLPLVIFVLVIYGVKNLISVTVGSLMDWGPLRQNYDWIDSDEDEDDSDAR